MICRLVITPESKTTIANRFRYLELITKLDFRHVKEMIRTQHQAQNGKRLTFKSKSRGRLQPKSVADWCAV